LSQDLEQLVAGSAPSRWDWQLSDVQVPARFANESGPVLDISLLGSAESPARGVVRLSTFTEYRLCRECGY
jgi:hypothetical protein